MAKLTAPDILPGMITLFHFVRLAFQNLRRGGQRVLVALLCIVFGITALVSLTMIAKSIGSAILVEPAELIGGNLSMARTTEETLLPEHIEQLAELQRRGAISRYTLIAYNSSSIAFHAAGAGDLHFAGIGMGIQPDQYPLVGSLSIQEPGGAGLPALLQQVGDVVVTRDLALEYNLKVGDPLILADLRSGAPLEGRVRGIAYDTPNHQGDKIYYTIETAQKLASGQPVINTVIVNTGQAEAVTEELNSSGWSVDWAADRRAGSPANLWVIGLRGAGILGLLVSGIGVANTMQVLLRRRQGEIAIWKTLGYRQSDLHLIFTLEAGLLGLGGSLIGAGLGILISGMVLEWLRRVSTVLYQLTFSPIPPLIGILTGTLTTVIFATWVIVVSGQTRPAALLRGERIEVQPLSGCLTAWLGLLLAAAFTALASLVMESLAGGIGVLVCTLFGLAGLGSFFAGLLWVCARVLPLRGLPLARIALHSLRRRGKALIFAMIALFVGVLSMSLGLAVTQFSQLKISGQSIDFQGYNLAILAAAGQDGAVRQAVQTANPEKVGTGYRTALAGVRKPGGEAVTALDPVLVGRSDPGDYVLSGAAWGSQPDGVYASRRQT